MTDPEIVGSATNAAMVVAALNSENAGKLIDALQPALHQLGLAAADVVRVVRAPVQLAATVAERWVSLVTISFGSVPKERRQDPPPSISGAIFEQVKHIEEGSPLLKLYEELLTSAMDVNRVHHAHPAFPSLIGQLSADEALWLADIATNRPTIHDTERVYGVGGSSERRTHKTRKLSLPGSIFFPQNSGMYQAHLMALNLINMLPQSTDTSGTDENGQPFVLLETRTTLFLSDFGRMFASACIPSNWDFDHKEHLLTRE